MFAGLRDIPAPTAFPARTEEAGRGRARRRPAWLRHRRAPAPHPSVSPAVVEEEAANLLYGERSGMVNASPVVPPLGEEEAG